MRSGILILGSAATLGTIAAVFYVLFRDDVTVAAGRVLYDANCASCHGDTLEGQPDWRSTGADGRYPAPPHDATGHTWHHSDAALIDYVTLGGEEALAQMGVSFESGMPGFGDILSRKDIEDILTYIKSRWPERERAAQAARTRSGDQ